MSIEFRTKFMNSSEITKDFIDTLMCIGDGNAVSYGCY